jgi:WD40 repeat protein
VVPEGGAVDAVAFSSDGRWLAYTTSNASQDSAWVLWDVAAKKLLRRTVVLKCGRQPVIGFAPEQELRVITGGADGVLRSWSGPTAEKAQRSFPTGMPIQTLAFSPLRRMMAVGGSKYFSLRSYLTEASEYKSLSQEGDIQSVAFSPTEQQVCWCAGSKIECIDLTTKRLASTLQIDDGNVLSMAYTPDATRMFTASSNGKLSLLWINEPAK